MVNHYKILGVRNFAPADEIKIAYRKLSRKLHPDVNDGDPFFTEKFKELQGAYETLSVSHRKSRHDMELREYLAGMNRPGTTSNTNTEESTSTYSKQEEPKPEEQKPKSGKKENIRTKTGDKVPASVKSIFFVIMVIVAIIYSIAKAFTKNNDNISSFAETSTGSTSNTAVDTSYITVDTTTLVESNAYRTEIHSEGSKTESPGKDEKVALAKEFNNSDATYFTIGSSKEEVLQVQGDPSKIEDWVSFKQWIYRGIGTVDIDNYGKVKTFDNFSGHLKVKMIDESEIESSSYFTIGSTKQEVLQVQGDPSKIEDWVSFKQWIYSGIGTVDIDNYGKVKTFDNFSGLLKIKMIDKMEMESGSYFTIGSSKEKVLRVQGDPSKIEDWVSFKQWIYRGIGTVDIDNYGKVKTFDNFSRRLKVKM